MLIYSNLFYKYGNNIKIDQQVQTLQEKKLNKEKVMVDQMEQCHLLGSCAMFQPQLSN